MRQGCACCPCTVSLQGTHKTPGRPKVLNRYLLTQWTDKCANQSLSPLGQSSMSLLPSCHTLPHRLHLAANSRKPWVLKRAEKSQALVLHYLAADLGISFELCANYLSSPCFKLPLLLKQHWAHWSALMIKWDNPCKRLRIVWQTLSIQYMQLFLLLALLWVSKPSPTYKLPRRNANKHNPE